jgi:pimeloyl-[acyl-carrier protein] synthase
VPQTPVFQFNPLSPEFQANPYPYYEMLRTNAPLFFWPDWGIWFLSRYDDCVAVLKDPRFGHEILKVMSREELGWPPEPPPDQASLAAVQRLWILFRDPPDHTRLRTLVHKAFTPRMVEQLREDIQRLTDALLDAAQAKGQMDIIADLAFPLPVTVIANLLGVPLADQEMFRRWSRDLAGTLELTSAEEVYRRGSQAAAEFSIYFRELAAERRQKPQDDLLSALVAVSSEGDRLTEDELISTCILLLIAGHETTVNLIGNGTLALLRHPDQFDKLKADPSLVKSAVEELLRYESPVQLTSRIVLEDVEFGGQQFRRGQQVTTLLGAANRDPERFSDPARLDITRADNKHIAFGSGIHFCLGAPLARLEGQIAFATLAQRFPTLQLATDDPPYRDTLVLRGLQSLSVTF